MLIFLALVESESIWRLIFFRNSFYFYSLVDMSDFVTGHLYFADLYDLTVINCILYFLEIPGKAFSWMNEIKGGVNIKMIKWSAIYVIPLNCWLTVSLPVIPQVYSMTRFFGLHLEISLHWMITINIAYTGIQTSIYLLLFAFIVYKVISIR